METSVKNVDTFVGKLYSRLRISPNFRTTARRYSPNPPWAFNRFALLIVVSPGMLTFSRAAGANDSQPFAIASNSGCAMDWMVTIDVLPR